MVLKAPTRIGDAQSLWGARACGWSPFCSPYGAILFSFHPPHTCVNRTSGIKGDSHMYIYISLRNLLRSSSTRKTPDVFKGFTPQLAQGVFRNFPRCNGAPFPLLFEIMSFYTRVTVVYLAGWGYGQGATILPPLLAPSLITMEERFYWEKRQRF